MRCTQEQFDDVKEELKEYQDVKDIDSFDIFNVLYFNGSYVTNIKDTDVVFAFSNLSLIDAWDKSLFLKMAGKPDAESRELLGYKRNPEFPITAEQLPCIIGGTSLEKGGLYFWEGTYESEPFLRACKLGIVGEGKWLVPVYKNQEKEVRSFGSLRHLTYEQQKGGMG